MNARTSLILLLFFGWSAGSWYWYTCKIKNFCPGANPTVEAPAIAEPDPEPVMIEPEVVDSGPLVFQWSNATPVTNDKFADYKNEILSKLKDNQVLEVVGKYYTNETNSTSYDNLGVARAEGIKAMLANDMDADKIETRGQLVDDGSGNQEGSFEGANFNYLTRSDVVQEVAGAILIYFPFNSTEKNLDPEIDSYLDDLAARLKDTDQKIAVTGHTDNVGNDQANYNLGLKRANSVKDILVGKGISADRITDASQGENAPFASNDTDEGRAKNRRIELKVE
ncbi:MAG: OmpA family protein [Cyclobacteriaceae bacterium]